MPEDGYCYRCGHHRLLDSLLKWCAECLTRWRLTYTEDEHYGRDIDMTNTNYQPGRGTTWPTKVRAADDPPAPEAKSAIPRGTIKVKRKDTEVVALDIKDEDD